MNREIKAACVGFLLAMAVCWYGGADFSQRSTGNAFLLVECLLCGLVAYFFTKAQRYE